MSASGEKKSGLRINTAVLGVLLLGGAVLASFYQVISNQAQNEYPGKTVIRICHWQLEAGYRNAIQTAIDEYEKIHPDVKIIQEGVTEKVYPQWLNTHLIAGDAPDLAEVGKAKFSAEDQYTVRYFRPLSDVISQPNPYNKGTPLEGMAWKETFIDGMRGGYKPDLQDYYTIPTTMFNMRWFYNKDLMRAATGSDAPLKTFDEFLEASRKVREYSKRTGVTITPVVNNYGPDFWSLLVPFTANLEEKVDWDIDGWLSQVESYAAFARGDWNMHTPIIEEYFKALKIQCEQYEAGFLSMDRQTALYRFAQQQAMILFTGSWDAQSIKKQCEGKFEVGVMEVPIPVPGERWGDMVRGRATEASNTGGAGYGVYKFSRNQDVAIDFLMFLTSRKDNGRIMEMAGWPPIVVGSAVSEEMKPFVPNARGYTARLYFDIGDQVTTVFNGKRDQFLTGEITYDEFAKAYEDTMRSPDNGGDRIWARFYDDEMRQCRTMERLLAAQSMRMLVDPKATDAPKKYRQTLQQQVSRNNGQGSKYRFKQVRGAEIPPI